jgi:hypothetical protein
MKSLHTLVATCLLFLASVSLAGAETTYSWRYYRPGNTGIQGDWNESIWIGADGDPWIGGYNPIAEEGGVAKFLQAENRWINVSNIDYPVIGSANDVGFCRVTDMVADGLGNLWMGTWRGVLRMNLAAGPSSLVKYGPGNSALPGGLTRDMTIAPDGSIWISAESTIWAGGGLTRYSPGTDTWIHMDGHGGGKIAAQPKPGGGYYIWASNDGFSPVERWNSTTQAWNIYPTSSGNPSHLVSLDSADDAGNVWMLRWIGVQGQETLDCLRPDGTWVTPPLPPAHPQVGVAALRAFGTLQALMVNGYGHLYRFNGVSWTDLGPEPYSGFIQDLDIDAAGNVWLCGSDTGGAFRRDAETGFWQRYRVTNTSQFDLFNNDLALDPRTGDVYACANASAGIGGMVKFDGTRWTGFVNEAGYGLTGPWPWPGAPQSEAVHVRPSNGHVVANPINQFTHEFDGTSWTSLPGGSDQVEQYVEDSFGRLWGMGHYGGMGIFENGGFTLLDTGGWSGRLQVDPDRPGTVWANEDWKILRTDGSYSFSRVIEDFPELTPNSSSFLGLAVGHSGICWVGASTSTGGALIRIDANTGSHQIWRSNLGWPFPGDHVYPLTVTPDGRVWMSYDSEYPSTVAGLLWWDGAQIGVFPAPPNGAWQWGGLPHAAILDLEVKVIPGGYELWMSCVSRGLAVLTVQTPDPASVDPGTGAPVLALEQNWPNPFRTSTQLGFSIPRAGHVRLTVFDVAGRAVRNLADGEMSAGRHEITWDGTDDGHCSLNNGVYFFRLDRAGKSLQQRTILLR